MFGFNDWNTWTILLEALSREYIGISDTESAINELADGRHRLKSEQTTQTGSCQTYRFGQETKRLEIGGNLFIAEAIWLSERNDRNRRNLLSVQIFDKP